MTLPDLQGAFMIYVMVYIPLICIMVPPVLLLFPKSAEEKYFGPESLNAYYGQLLKSPQFWFFKANVIAGSVVIVRWQKYKHLEGLHLACPSWYVKLCWVYYFVMVVFGMISLVGIFVLQPFV